MTTYALHTATNYTNTRNELRGCINDWKNFLRLDDELNIPEENRISLIGANYKKDLAAEAVSKFASLMRPGDMLIGSNAGHGIAVPDLDGDESDGKDEALVDNYNQLILDDDIFQGLRKFQERTLIVAWLDNCHAGTMDRSFRTKDWHLMSPEIVCNAVMLFGCRENQTSADAFIDGQFQGALTATSLEVLRAHNMQCTYLQLLTDTNALLRARNFSQVAQMAVTSEELLHKQVFTM